MKKVISLIIVVAMLIAMVTVSFNALSVSDEGVITAKEAVEAEGLTPGNPDDTQRIYFQMPNGNRGGTADTDKSVHHPDVLDPDTGEVVTPGYDEVVIHAGEKAPSWYSDYDVVDGLHYAGAYWWGGTAAASGWCGYRAEIADYDQGIYYVDVPKDVVVVVWNNGVDGGTDSSEPIYYEAAQTTDTNIEGAFEGDYDSLPYGSPDPYFFDHCIYVVDPNQVSINAFSQKQTCGGNWYVYYGDGCYGSEFPEGIGDEAEYPDGTPDWSDDMQDVCLNPDHFVDGVHVGYHEDEPSTKVLLGDANGDRMVNAYDATAISMFIEGTWTYAFNELAADVNFDGQITANDSAMILDYISGQAVPSPIGEVVDVTQYEPIVTPTEAPQPTVAPTEAPQPTEPPIVLEENKLYFDIDGTGWELGSKDKVSFYVYSITAGEELIPWGGKKLQGTKVAGTDTIWSYDPAAKGMNLNDDELYFIIFVSPAGQTYDLLFDTTCLGHMAKCDGTEYENPVDSSQKVLAAFWTDLDASEYGPRLQISSTGNVVGTCLEAGKTAEDVFTTFITSDGATGLVNAREYSDKTEQKMIDDIGAALGLTKQQVYDAFAAAEVETAWDYTQSALPGTVVLPTEAPVPTEAPTEAPVPTEAPTEAPQPTEPAVTGICGDVDGSGEVDIVDVTFIQRILASIIPGTREMRVRGDVNKNDELEIIDATFIQRYLVAINDSYGIGYPLA